MLFGQLWTPTHWVLLDLLVQLDVRGFRNLESSSYDLTDGSHLIIGANGAGKTSLLEAIYLLATTRSFRTPRIADCCQHGASVYCLTGEVDTDRRLRLDFRWEEGHSHRLVNGCRTSLAEHLSALSIVSWSAADSDILVGPPSARRRFLDRGVLGLKPAAIDIFSRYRKALQEKRQLLRHGGEELTVWNEVLAAAASEVVVLRSTYTNRLREVLNAILEDCGLGLGVIELNYRCSLHSGLEGPAAIASELMAASDKERVLQQPILGPHRDDLSIRWDGHELKKVASAGERKALGLALLAAHGRVLSEMGRDTVYLLDDADTELDKERLTALWRVFGSVRQLLFTSNRAHVWGEVEIGYRWNCSAGRLEPG